MSDKNSGLKRKVRLTHICNMPGYVGHPGDVIEVPEHIALMWIAARGAVDVSAEKPAAKPDRDDEGDGADAEPFAQLDLPDSVKERMTKAGWKSIADVRAALDSEGGLAGAGGIGKVTADQIAEELAKITQEG